LGSVGFIGFADQNLNAEFLFSRLTAVVRSQVARISA
jgi:hypothetical protein